MSYVYVIHMKWYPSLFLGCSNQLQVAQEQVLKANKIGGLPCHPYNTYEMVPLIVPNVFHWLHGLYIHLTATTVQRCATQSIPLCLLSIVPAVHCACCPLCLLSIVPAVYTYFSLDSET